MSTAIRMPSAKMGWMKKQGRKGMIKSWKTRFFVLEAGKLLYYQNQLDTPPYGEILKGEMSLANTEIVEEYKKGNDCQIYIVSYNGENNMLMEADNMEECLKWVAGLKLHCAFADADAENNVVINNKRQSTGSSRSESSTTVSSPAVETATTQSGNKEPVTTQQSTHSTAPAASSTSSISTAPAAPTPTKEVPVAATTTTPAQAAPVAATESSSSDSGKRSSVALPTSAPTATATSAPATDLRRASVMMTAVEVDTDGPPVNPLDVFNNITEGFSSVLSTLTQTDKRDRFVAQLKANATVSATSLVKNAQEGEMGKRGEEYFVLLFALSFCILVGVHPVIFWLISALIHLSSVVYIVGGFALILAGLWDLKANVSPFISPVKDNVLVTSGVYALARHPMYGGLVLLCIGRSIRTGSMEKFLMSIVLAFVLDVVSQVEESLLSAAHPRKYREYARNKKKLIPFLY